MTGLNRFASKKQNKSQHYNDSASAFSSLKEITNKDLTRERVASPSATPTQNQSQNQPQNQPIAPPPQQPEQVVSTNIQNQNNQANVDKTDSALNNQALKNAILKETKQQEIANNLEKPATNNNKQTENEANSESNPNEASPKEEGGPEKKKPESFYKTNIVGSEQSQEDSGWDVIPSFDKKDDPLMRCLLVICKMLKRNVTKNSIAAGLPLADGIMTPEFFIRAANSHDISARLLNKKMNRITNIMLPAVILLKGKSAAVLTEIVDKETAKIILSDSGEGETEVSMEELTKNYAGYMIFARPRFRYDKRADTLNLIPQDKNLVWGSIKSLWSIFAEVILATFLFNILMIVAPLFMMNVYDRVLPHLAFETMWVLAVGVFAGIIFNLVLMNMRSYLLELAGKAIHKRVTGRAFQQMLGLKMSERGASPSALANKVNSFEQVRSLLSSGQLLALFDLPFVFLFLFIIFIIGGVLVFVPLTVMIVLLTISFGLRPLLKKLSNEEDKQRDYRNSVMNEVSSGIETIKATGAESRMQRDWELMMEETSNNTMRTSRITQFISSLSMSAMHVNMIGLIIVGVYQVESENISMGAIIASNMLSMRIMRPLTQLSMLGTRLESALTAFQNLNSIMSKEVERPDSKNFVHRETFRGNIEFKNVSFSYPESETSALENVTFKIREGEKVGIIGRVGSGKTTIERLLIGLHEPTEGAVMVDNIDVRQIDPAELRRNVGTVPQDIFLFDGSIHDNIVVAAPYADNAMILRASHIAGVEEFVSKHPSGMDMPVGERGNSLSGGQRQEVAIARAFLTDPPIIMLDEPTSAMDTTSENKFIDRMDNLMPNKTLVIVTHRYSLLRLVDRLIVMDSGHVVADGPKEQIFEALKNGTIKAIDV